MITLGKVYKAVSNNDLLRTPVYVGVSYVIMMNVVQDNSQTQEFQLDTSNDFEVTVGAFNAAWEIVEGLDIKDQVDAFMSPYYN